MDNLLVPPHSLEAEQGLISSIIKDNRLFDDAIEITGKKEFYSRSHRLIFENIEQLITNGSPVDLITLTDSLERKSILDDAGGFVYIAQIIKDNVSTLNVKAYAKIIRENFVKRELLAASNNIQEAVFNSPSDSKELCLLAEKEIGDISDVHTSTKTNKTMRDVAEVFVDELDRRATSGKSILGISTGLIDLDGKISGLGKSDLILLAARPSMGKTTLAMNMVEQEALGGGFPLVFSLEMPCEQLFMKMVSSVGNVDFNSLKMARLNDEQWGRVNNATMLLNDSNLEINDSSTMTVQDIRLSCREYKKKHKDITLIMIDYAQLIRGNNKDNRTQEISEISRGLKALAKEFQCPVLALSQLNRGLESRSNKRPINSDLRESGQLEQDADVIMFIYRDEVYNPDSQDKGLAEIIIGKARNGTIGMVGAVFDGAKSKFRDLAGLAITGEQEEEKGFF